MPADVSQHGAAAWAAGLSPSRWFDEAFYLASNQDVRDLISDGRVASGFAHYCEAGYSTRAPHWLFDPAFYAVQNPGLTGAVLQAAGFVNGYDHFLKHGAAEQRQGHPFFDPVEYSRPLDPDAADACARLGAFQHFLLGDWRGGEPPASRHFDPAWYRRRYPGVEADIQAGVWHSALHHYLMQGRAGGFHPLPPAPAGTSTVEAAAGRIRIHVDRPRHANGEAAESIEGHLDIVGWAAATHPVLAVDVYVDGEHCGRAHHGIRTESVAAAFPDLAHAMFAGFRFIAPAHVTAGRHRLRIVARGEGGLETEAAFTAAFEPAALQDGPWCLRRRMRGSEAALNNRLLEDAGLGTDFVIVLTGASDGSDGLQRTMQSLERQVYQRWRLDDGAASADMLDAWLVPLTPGDELGVDALLELARHRLVQPSAEFLYSDERRIDPNTGAMAPFFKPDWSPDLLLAADYIGRLWTAPAALVERAGLLMSDLAACANHELVLRLTERSEEIGHVPLVLCESAPRPAGAGPIRRALARRGIMGRVEPGLAPQSWRSRHTLDAPPRVSVIIPTAGARGLIGGALHMLRERTAWQDLELIVIDTVPRADAPWKATARALADRLVEDAGPFNWSRLSNLGASHATGALLLFLNDDVALPDDGDPAWLHAMVEALECPGVGIVGARLLYPAGLVQHAGMFLHRTGGRNAFAGLPGSAPGPFGLALTTRNVSAVTGACLLVRHSSYRQLGGFDERLDIACNDADFCLRALHAGWRVVATPHATLTHHESVTRTGLPEAHNEALFAETWRTHLAAGDPYFSRHLSLAHTDWRPDPEFIETVYPSRPLAALGTIRRILVIKLDHIGDFLLALPAIRALKRAFGHARLTLLADPQLCALAAMDPCIDDTIAHPWLTPWVAEVAPTGWASLGETLRAEHFDLAVDLRCHAETRPLLEACGATWRAGFDAGFAFPWLDIVGLWEPDTARAAKRTHMADTLLNFAAKIASAFTDPAEDWPLPPVAGEAGAPPGRAGAVRARSPWPENLPAPPPGALRIAIHPGAGAPIKQWPAAHFATLMDTLAGRADAWFILVGTEADRSLADQIAALLRPQTRLASACGLTGLDDLARLLAACDLCIGNDSGPHHLAAALGVPTLGIHSGIVDTREWSPLGPSALAARRRVHCSPCYLADTSDCPRSLACLNDLTPAVVLDKVIALTAG